jgi:hypothetical protein
VLGGGDTQSHGSAQRSESKARTEFQPLLTHWQDVLDSEQPVQLHIVDCFTALGFWMGPDIHSCSHKIK